MLLTFRSRTLRWTIRLTLVVFWTTFIGASNRSDVAASSGGGQRRSGAPVPVTWTSYASAEQGFSFEYPRGWTPSTSFTAVDVPGLVLSVEDSRNLTNGIEPAGESYPRLQIKVFDQRSYRTPPPSVYFGVPLNEISTREQRVTASGQTAALRRHTTTAPEGSTKITQLIELAASGRIYLLDYSYTQAGCSNVGEAFRSDCLASNRTLTTEGDRIFEHILATFKIRH